jgi:ethanolamine utilization protein EutP
MKKLLMIGTVSCGKTTLSQYLSGMELVYKKTQALDVIGTAIDTPGEYLEHRAYMRNLMVLSADVDYALFLMDPTQERFMYSPGHPASFPVPVIGVVTKIDIATPKQIADAREMLEITGADPIFSISSYTGEGIHELLKYIG